MLRCAAWFAGVAATLAALATGACTHFEKHGPGTAGESTSGGVGNAGAPDQGGAPSTVLAKGGAATASDGISGGAGHDASGMADDTAAAGGHAGAGGNLARAGGGGTGTGNGGAGNGGAGNACHSARSAGYRVGFYPENKNVTEQELHPFFQLTNTNGKPLSLTRIKLRYYFTKEPSGAETWQCYWVTGDLCSSVALNFQVLDPAFPTANRFMELTFRATSADLDGSPLEARVGFSVARSNFTQSNDYSFDPGSGMPLAPGVFPYGDWDRVTLYVDDVLVWGIEPCAN